MAETLAVICQKHMTIAAKNAKSAKALLWFLICAFLRALRQKIILSLRLSASAVKIILRMVTLAINRGLIQQPDGVTSGSNQALLCPAFQVLL